jgi:hypothetical protein
MMTGDDSEDSQVVDNYVLSSLSSSSLHNRHLQLNENFYLNGEPSKSHAE